MLNHDKNRLESLVKVHGVVGVLETLYHIAEARVAVAEDKKHAKMVVDELATTLHLLHVEVS